MAKRRLPALLRLVLLLACLLCLNGARAQAAPLPGEMALLACPPAAPIPSGPLDGAGFTQADTIHLAWGAVAGAEKYGVVVSPNPNGDPQQIFVQPTNTYFNIAPGTLPLGTWYWGVAAFDVNCGPVGQWGSNSPARTIRVCTPPGVPELALPANGAHVLAGPLTLTWAAASGAVSYEVQVSADSGFSTIAGSAAPSSTSCTITLSNACGLYYWRVRAVNDCVPGAWSSVRSANLCVPPAPALAGPAEGASFPNSWDINLYVTPACSFQYRYEIYGDAGLTLFKGFFFGSPYATVPANFLPVGVYYWRARGEDPVCGAGDWSAVRSLSVCVNPLAPTLTSPAGGAAFPAGVDVTFQWEPWWSATSYRVGVFSSVSEVTPVWQQTSGTTSATLPAGTLSPGSYTWAVQSVNSCTSSAWSAKRAFTLGGATITPWPTATATATKAATRTASRTATATFTRAPTATPTATRTATSTRTPSRTRTPSPTATSTPLPDLVAGKLEVTQVVQDLNNSVRLVAGKQTFVRFHVRSTGGTYPARAMLLASSPAGTIPLLPLNTVLVGPSPDRGKIDDAFLFELPSGWRDSAVALTAILNPAPYSPAEATYANNTATTVVSFEGAPAPQVMIFKVGYNIGDKSYWPSNNDVNMLASYLRRAYPANGVSVIVRDLWYGFGLVEGDKLTLPNCYELDLRLAVIKMWDNAFTFGALSGYHYYGMVSDGGGFMRGCALGVPSWVASGPTGTRWFGWDKDGSYGDWYGAHELAHTYGRGHANFCGAEGGGSFPYTDGLISPSLDGDGALYGFDASTRQIYAPTWHDLMTYCPEEWPSDFTYEGLLNFFKNPTGLSQGAQPAEAAIDRLCVAGTLDPGIRQVRLQTPFVIPATGDLLPRTPGAYSIVLRGAGYQELARYPFTPRPIQLGPDLPAASARQAEPQMYSIMELVPYVAGTTRLEIVDAVGLLASVSAGANAPTVSLTSPNGGEVLSGASVQVSWAASDPDGDPLHFNVQYSRDNGASWEMVAQGITGNSLQLDGANLPQTTQGRFRVWASDGIHTTSDASDGTFTVPNHVPEVQILAPPAGATVAISQTVALQATAYDVDEGSLAAERLTWSSDLDGILGHGADLSVANLRAGQHTLTFTADDGKGGTASAHVQLTVVADAASLPVPDRLIAGPSLVVLMPPAGTASATLGIENKNGERAIRWQASSDQAWLALSSTSGSTPAQVRLSYSGAGQPTRGTGSVVLTSPDLPGETVRIAVALIPAEHAFHLPVLLRR